MSPMYLQSGGGEVPREQVRHRGGGRLGDRGADAAAQADARDGELAHHAGHPLGVDLPAVGTQLGGHPRRAVGALGAGVDGTDLLGQRLIGCLPRGTGSGAVLPFVVAGTVQA